MLRTIESKLESLFEGVFGRAFRTNVQPVELARKLVKEMDEHRSVSVSRVYVPNEYTVYLAPDDREQFAGYETQLRGELAEYLAEHARREDYVLITPPQVAFETDDDLDVGVFGIATRMAQPADVSAEDAEGAAQPPANATMVYKPAAQPTEAASPVELDVEREVAVLEWSGERHEISKRRVLIGRSRDADIRVDDPNVSRRHAEVQQEGTAWWLVDLDSTNGVEVNGRRVKRLKLEDGARFTIGSTEIAFSRELQ
jgi:FhaA, N-terminal domain/FHA domain